MRSTFLAFAFPAFVLASLAPLAACGGSTDAQSSPPPSSEAGTEPPPVTKRPPPKPDASAPQTFCDRAGTHAFCADFDTDTGLGEWDDIIRGNDNAHRDDYGVTPSDRSAPNALYIRGDELPRPDGGQDPTGPWSGMFLVKKLPSTTAHKAHLSLDVRVAANGDFVDVFQLEGRTKTNAYAFNLSLELTRSASHLAGALGTIPALPALPMNQWVHVDVVADADAGTATLSYDGKAVGTAKFEGAFDTSVDSNLYLGVSRTAPSGAYDIAFDTVVLDFE